MRKMKNRLMVGLLSIILAFTYVLPVGTVSSYAEEAIDPVVIVSFGDSYSSGEGIEPFYGQNKSISEKVEDEDWLAHRSEKSWPGLLEIPGISGTAKDYRITGSSGRGRDMEWYFVASSGAVASNIHSTEQSKYYNKRDGWLLSHTDYTGTKYLPVQDTVFDNISSSVDYVTLTIGGNDVDFADIITECATGSTYLGTSSLNDKMNNLWNNIDDTLSNIKTAYSDLSQKAGPQAEIVVAGYPKLLDNSGKGFLISEEEAKTVNKNVSKFNDRLEELVGECSDEGMNIHFVSVEEEFSGHEAYSSNAWINKINLFAEDEDLDRKAIASSYSVHPNADGAKAYARCVNAKIAEIEEAKRTGTLSGKICKASDRLTPVSEASIEVYKDGTPYATAISNGTGNYSISLPEGDYKVVIEADGYISFDAYATVTYDRNTYMETFLLIAGTPGEQGTASGVITSALTGRGVENVSLTVREGWNTPETGKVVGYSATNANGAYSLTLPIGNYTLKAEKEGYIGTSVNIIVQPGDTSSQNGSITPILSEGDFRLVLTWGANPSDLDSHMEGTLVSDANHFHVYYSHKSQYDGEVEVCNLDVDDVSSYGPETITLNPTNDTPYYYYIYKYAGSGTVAESGAKINVYQGETLLATFNVPTDLGSGRYWNVFAIRNGQIIPRNTMTDSAETTYAD